MARRHQPQNQFNAGELSHRLYSRSDVDKYQNALKTATNALCTVHGPIHRRNGTKYISSVKDSSVEAGLISFQFSEDEAYVLELGNQYIRFYTDRGQVLDNTTITNGTFASDISGWTDRSAGTGSIAHDAGNERMSLVGAGGGNEARAYETFASVGIGTYTVTTDVFTGAVTYRVGTTIGGSDIATGSVSVGTGQTFTFSPSAAGTVYLEFENANSDTRQIDNVSIDTPPYEIESPYLTAHVAELAITQFGETLYIAHPSYPPRKLVSISVSNWTTEEIEFLPPATYEPGYAPSTTCTPGATSGSAVNFTAGSATFLQGDVGRQIVHNVGTGRAVITEITSTTVAVCDILEAFPNTDAIASGDWKMDLSPIADLTPSGLAAGSIITLRSEYPSGSRGPAVAISGITNANPGRVTTSSVHNLVEGDVVEIKDVEGMTQANNTLFTVDYNSTTTFDLAGINTTNYMAYTSGGEVRQSLTDLKQETFRSDDVGKYILINGGVVQITALVSAHEVEAEVLKSLNDKDRSGNWTMEVPAWDATRGYPRAVGLYEERLVFASTAEQPQTIWFSEVGIFDGMGPGPDDDDAIVVTISSSKVNQVNWIAASRDLVLGTSGSELTITSSSAGPITPSSIKQVPRTYHGSSRQQPIVIGAEILFVQSSERKVRTFRYDFDIDGYVGEDLHFLADHMTSGLIKQIAYAQEPDSFIYAVLRDGDMLVGTYDRTQQVIGWSRFTTDGSYEAVQVIGSGSRDDVYVIVNRTINGATKRYVEVFDSGDGTDAIDGFSDSYLTYSNPKTITGITQANPAVVTSASHGYSNGDSIKIVDVVGMTELNNRTFTAANVTTNTFELTSEDSSSYTAYSSGGEAHKLVSTVSGLDHLEGKTVQLKLNGATAPDATVSSGAVTLPTSAYDVTVGLPYTTTIETLNKEYDIGAGSQQAQRTSWVRPTIRVYKSARPLLNGDILPSRVPSDLMDVSVPLYTGDLEYGSVSWDSKGILTFTLSDPLPLQLGAIFGIIQGEMN